MRLMIVRHGDPDYIHDSLTEKGKREAELLSKRLAKMDIQEFYQSPLGRAQLTASYTLHEMHREAETLDWLREFDPRIIRPDRILRKSVAWDWQVEDWTKDCRFYDYDHWYENDVMRRGNVKEKYQWVCDNFDVFLKEHGYVHDGKLFRVEKGNHDTIVFFCHFGVECVLLSHLLHISPMILWQGFVAAPSSVTIVHTEERRKGIAAFRIAQFGDISHLYAADEQPSFAARFVECYEDDGQH